MFLKKRFFQIAVAIFLLKATVDGQVNHNGDFQYWQYVIIEKALVDAWSTRLTAVMRWGDNASTFYNSYGQWQAVYTTPWLEVAPGYRQEYVKPDKQWFTTYAPMCDFTLFFRGTWQLEDRNRVLHQHPEHALSVWVYRNRLRFISPELTPCFKLKFFIADEAFFVERAGFNQNRFLIGVLGAPTTWFRANVYYIYRSLKQGEIWTHQNVLSCDILF